MDPIETFVKNVEDKDAAITEIGLDKYSLAPWSISKLKCIQKCPFNFYLKYILKIKVPEEVAGEQDTQAADIGSSAHRILELVVLGKDVSTAFKLTKAEFVPKKLTKEQWEEHVENLEMSVIAFKDRM
jgi:ATP-dependent helicase/DNAse subunit B